eukprot:CAMPEP_0194479740 /NCGR_PEP_ID=MMETSP0253-20130528/2772_1 /TAXON_ID=2966 /ORGANISM="Noctiluca scintillans" /LENGTH=42 /DNA_ID= /DNA_START= /DNA_END= /DNA_ORIENTATION=
MANTVCHGSSVDTTRVFTPVGMPTGQTSLTSSRDLTGKPNVI